MAVCPRCGDEFPDRKPGSPGGPRKWCSAACRRRAASDNARASCSDCGAKMSVGSGWPSRTRIRCRVCHNKREAAAHRARVEDVAQMYNDGMSIREIGKTLGWGETSRPPELVEARKLGLLTGYRYKAYENRDAPAGNIVAAGPETPE